MEGGYTADDKGVVTEVNCLYTYSKGAEPDTGASDPCVVNSQGKTVSSGERRMDQGVGTDQL